MLTLRGWAALPLLAGPSRRGGPADRTFVNRQRRPWPAALHARTMTGT